MRRSYQLEAVEEGHVCHLTCVPACPAAPAADTGKPRSQLAQKLHCQLAPAVSPSNGGLSLLAGLREDTSGKAGSGALLRSG